MRTKGEPDSQLQRISGEAHFLRAFIYFMLVNAYGQPYSKASAQTDPGVPLKTEPSVDDQFFPRNTVQQVYDQVTADLLAAEKELETYNAGNAIRANAVAVQALLSRVYLYQGDYEKAILYADKVLAQPTYKLYDLNQYVAGADFNTKTSPETIFTMGRTAMPFLMYSFTDKPNDEFYRLSNELASAYKPEDLRVDAFYTRNSEGFLRCVKTHSISATAQDVSDCWLLRLAEVYLNKAEALALLGRDQEAINTVQQLRKARFKPADLTGISDAGEALVNLIRDERRLELSFEGHRWFDLRRYAVSPKWPFSKTIRHDAISWNGAAYIQTGYFELKPYDQDKAAYIVPIARDETEFNSGVLQNAARPARPLKN
jgi:tetratricopeptide (TPR) repeat protein